MKQLLSFTLLLFATGFIISACDHSNSNYSSSDSTFTSIVSEDSLTATSLKYVVDLPVQLDSIDKNKKVYFVAYSIHDSVYVYKSPSNDYQIRLNRGKVYTHNRMWDGLQSFTLMDEDREVSTFTDSFLDSLIINDNQ